MSSASLRVAQDAVDDRENLSLMPFNDLPERQISSRACTRRTRSGLFTGLMVHARLGSGTFPHRRELQNFAQSAHMLNLPTRSDTAGFHLCFPQDSRLVLKGPFKPKPAIVQ